MDKNQQLIERNKELNCLYEIDALGYDSTNLDDYFKQLMKIIQNGFQYVSYLNVQIEYKNQNYKSPYFQETKHFLTERLSFKDILIGKITVFYSSEKLKSNEPFLNEEKRLMFSIARRVSGFLYYYEKEVSDRQNQNIISETYCQTQLRLDIVESLCSTIDLELLGINAVYLIGSTKNYTAGKSSDIDLIIYYDGKESSLNKTNIWLKGWEASKKYEIEQFYVSKDKSIFDFHFITDKDIEENSSYAVMINSHNNSAKLLKKKKKKKKEKLMTKCFFVSDLHGRENRYNKLFELIKSDKPDVVFLGGDIYPPFNMSSTSYKNGFFQDLLVKNFSEIKQDLKESYPKIFIILGNDDPKTEEHLFYDVKYNQLWEYINNRKTKYLDYDIYGYSNIPPTPFINKDWELYDVSRYVDPGCIHPTEGRRSVIPGFDVEFTTIKQQIELLTSDNNLEKSIFLFHSPPYKTNLDRAALDGMFYDHIPLDVNVGSIAIKDMIEQKQPYLTLHGHIHESSRITGEWKQKTGDTWSFNAATDNNKLSLIIFELENPNISKRIII